MDGGERRGTESEEVGAVMMCYDFSWERTLTEEQISARTKKRHVCPCKVTTAGCSLLFQYQISFNKLQLLPEDTLRG